jgi:protein TonB
MLRPTRESPSLRLVAAIAVSALVHAWLTALSPGSAGVNRSPSVSSQPPITARLVTVEPELPVVEPALERTPVRRPTPPPRERKKAAPAAPSSPARSAGNESVLDIPDSTYYGARQLDVFPTLAGAFELRYPARAATGDVKGRVALLVLIDARGTVDEVSVVEAQPAGYFEEDALRVFRAAQFKPAMKGGRAVKSRIVIELNYGSESTTP